MTRSDEAIRNASDLDEASRCAVYRERVTLLNDAGRQACGIEGRYDGNRFSNTAAETAFFAGLIATKCNRTFDPSCSGPACGVRLDGG